MCRSSKKCVPEHGSDRETTKQREGARWVHNGMGERRVMKKKEREFGVFGHTFAALSMAATLDLTKLQEKLSLVDDAAAHLEIWGDMWARTC